MVIADDAHVLDNPVLTSLAGPHAHLAETRGRATRYHIDVSPLAALPTRSGPRDWADLAGLLGPGGTALLTDQVPPAGWEIVAELTGTQMVHSTVDAAAADADADPDVVELGAGDIADMLDLVRRTEPGPFRPRTSELGAFLGIRRGGALVAMAGERLRPPGWTEVSAVCTDPEHRGQGLAGRLIRAVAAGIHERGDTPFLHAANFNANAIRLYESLGFTHRRQVAFVVIRVPEVGGA